MGKSIIVGAGVAGLSAGIYARLNGFDATIYELHNIPGGEATAWTRKGYTFDNSIHWLLGTKEGTSLNAIWRRVGALGDDVSVTSLDTFFSMAPGAGLGASEAAGAGAGAAGFAGGKHADSQLTHVYTDADRLREHFLSISPEDAPAIDSLVASIKALRRLAMPTDKPFELMNPLDYARLAMSMGPALKHVGRLTKISIGDLADTFRSPRLRAALRGSIPADFTAISLVSTLATLWTGDSAWPAGGSLALAKRMETRFLDLGGKVVYRARVAEITE